MAEKQERKELLYELEKMDLKNGEKVTYETLLNLSDNKGDGE